MKSSWTTKIILVTSGLVVAFITLEIASRLLFNPPQSVTLEGLNKVPAQQFTSTLETPQYIDSALYYRTPTGLRIRSNVKAVIKNHYLSKQDIEVVTNSLGYRSPELGAKTDQDFRILVLGDSVTLGDYVQADQTYPSYIEKYLQGSGKLPGKNIQVINAGVGTIGLENELAILLETGLSTKPDIVLVGLYLNDAQESLGLKLLKPPVFSGKSRFLDWLFYTLSMVQTKYYLNFTAVDPDGEAQKFAQAHSASTENEQSDSEGFKKLIVDNFRDWGYAWSDNFPVKTKEVLTLMQELAQKNNFQLSVVMLPVRQQIEAESLHDEPQKNIEQVTKQLEISFFNLLPLLREKYQRDQINLYFDHAHLKTEGNDFIGQQINQFLLNQVINP